MARRGGGRRAAPRKSSGRRGRSSGGAGRRSGFSTGKSMFIRGSRGRFAGSKSTGYIGIAPDRRSMYVEGLKHSSRYIVVKKNPHPFTTGQANKVAKRMALNEVRGGGQLGRPAGRSNSGHRLTTKRIGRRSYVIAQIGA